MSILIKKSLQTQDNESKLRLIAFFVLILISVYWFRRALLIPAFLIIDFALRSFYLGNLSLLALLSNWLVTRLKLQGKLVYLPPKRFAARIGLAFSILLFILQILQLNTLIISGIFGLFAALESFAGFCAGCYVYNFLQGFKRYVHGK